MADDWGGGPDRRVVAIVGGGFSGLLTAVHLLRSDPAVEVRLIERAPLLGRGQPFRTRNPDHLLNVRAANMSALPHQPDHFLAWLGAAAGPDDFVSRGRYGDYLQSLLSEEMGVSGRGGRLLLKLDEAIGAQTGAQGGWTVRFRSGSTLRADALVLAVGLSAPAPPPGADAAALASPVYIADPWAQDLGKLPHEDVLLIGSGLTMVDVALSLAKGGRRITALSRHGLLPLTHAPTRAISPPPGPLSSPRQALSTLRTHAGEAGWREAVDSVRPTTSAVWRGWSLADRRRFLRHLRAWWDIHRHRMAPQIARRIQTLGERGQLEIVAGRLEGLRATAHGLEATLRRRGQTQATSRVFGSVVNCSGPEGNPNRVQTGLLADLREQGLLRGDALGLGLDVDTRLGVIGQDGRPTPALFAVGPLTRGAVWESMAVPDLRVQTLAAAGSVEAFLARSRAPGGERVA